MRALNLLRRDVTPVDEPTTPSSMTLLGASTHFSFWALVLLVLSTPAWREGIWAWGPSVAWPTTSGREAPIGLLSALPFLFVALWAAWRWKGVPAPWRWGPAPLTIPLLLLTGRLLVGLPLTPSWFTLTQLLGVALLWIGYLFFVNERPPWLWPLLFLVAVQGGVALAQFLLQGSVGLFWLGEMPLDPAVEGTSVVVARGVHWLRGYGLTAHPNFLGALLATLLVLLLPRFFSLRGARRTLFVMGWVLGLLGLCVTFSRAAMLGFVAGSAVYLIGQWRASPLLRRPVLLFIGTAAVGLLVLVPYYDLTLSRFLSLETPTEALSLQQRLSDSELAMRIITESPWGVGSGRYRTVAMEQRADAQVVHNFPLLAFAEFGVVGALACLMLLLVALGLWPRGSVFAPWVTLILIGLFDVTLWPFGSARPALLFGLLSGALALHVHEEAISPVTDLSRARQVACSGLFALAVLFPFEAVQPLLRLGGVVAFSTVEVVLLGAVALWVGGCFWDRRWPPVPATLWAPALLLLVVLLVAALAAPDYRATSLKFWTRMLNGVLVAWMTYDVTRNRLCWHRIARGMGLVALVVGLFGVAEAAGWSAPVAPFKSQIARVGDIDRISATLDYPTVAAMVLELTLPLLVVWAARARGWLRGLLLAGIVPALLTLVLTLSRAGLAGVAIGLLLLLAAAWWQRATPPARPVAIFAGSALGVLVLLTATIFYANPLTRLRLESETEQAWYQATYRADPLPTLRPGEQRRVPVQVRNTSVRSWDSARTEPFALAYHLYDSNDELIEYEGRRTFIEEVVQPGDVVEVQAVLNAPEAPGEYVVEWDMVQEGVSWFSWKEAEPLRQPLSVVGTADGSAPALEEPDAPPALLRVPTPTRSTLWRAALAMFQDRPLLGVGPETFRLNYGRYSDLELWDTNIHANNLYLEWLAGTGLLGLLVFLWLSWRLLRMAWEGLARASDQQWPWIAAVSVALVAWFAHGLLDYFFSFTPTYVAFWLLVGLLASARYRDTMP